MANTLLTPPETDPGKEGPTLRPAEAPQLNEETEGSMWASLFSNLRDVFNPVKEAPLVLESRPVENDLIIKEEGVFSSLWSSVRDVFFPQKLPPLVLESKPIAVVDPMKVKRDPKSTAMAVVIHGLVILLIAYMLIKKIAFTAPAKTTLVTDIAIPPHGSAESRRRWVVAADRSGPTPVTKGSPPKFADQQIVPPNKPPLVEPKIKIEPTVEVQKDVKMASSLPNVRSAEFAAGWDVDGEWQRNWAGFG